MAILNMPTVSTRGWLTTPELIMGEVFNNYVSANPSQSLLFNGNVYSLQYAVYLTNNNGSQLVTKVTSDLYAIYSEYASDIEFDNTFTNTDGKIELIISGTMVINGKSYTLYNSLNCTDSVYLKNNEVDIY